MVGLQGSIRDDDMLLLLLDLLTWFAVGSR